MLRLERFFWVILFVSGGLAGFSSIEAAANEAVVARVKALGGAVERNEQGEIVSIDLDNRPTQDADLEAIGEVTSLKKLRVWGAGISDAGMDHLVKLVNLTSLDLKNTQATVQESPSCERLPN